MKSGSLCAPLWRIRSWCTRQQVTLRARHIPGRLNVIADKLSRLGQTIQTEWSLHPEVFQAICNRWHHHQVDLFATTFYNKNPVVLPVPDPQAWAVDALSLSWEDMDPYAFPPAAILGKVVEKRQDYPCNRIILIAPGWPNMPWFLGPGSNVKPDPTVSAQHTQPSVSAIQPGPSQEPVESEPTCLAPRASAIKEQGFSEAVAARIEAPQRGLTRSVYEAKWAIFTKWCRSNQVDFRASPLKAIADFLLHLFRTRSCNQALLMATDQPLLTNWAIQPIMSGKKRISLVSGIVSIETDPRAGGTSPPGTFPWYCTSSQRLPLNPLKRPP